MIRFILLLLCFSANASEPDRWFGRHEEGWFWYERLEAPAQKSEEEIKPTISTDLQSLPVAWIRKNIGHYLDKAIDQPSKENVSRYLYLNRAVKEKAERFARVGKRVIESDPMLDENVRRPISPAAAKIKDDIAHQAKEAALKDLAKQTGLIFYYQGSCRLCRLQAQTIKLMQQIYGFQVIAVSTDRLIMPEFPDSRVETLIAPELNIRSYPALFIAHPPNNIHLLRQGVISFMGLIERVLVVAYEQGWITPKQFNSFLIAFR